MQLQPKRPNSTITMQPIGTNGVIPLRSSSKFTNIDAPNTMSQLESDKYEMSV